MIDDIDVWRAAALLIKRHGDDAPVVAAQRADELLAAGDLEGGVAWRQMLGGIRELTRTKLPDGERVN